MRPAFLLLIGLPSHSHESPRVDVARPENTQRVWSGRAGGGMGSGYKSDNCGVPPEKIAGLLMF